MGGQVEATKWKYNTLCLGSYLPCCEKNQTLVRHCISAVWMISDFSLLSQLLLRLDLLGPDPPSRNQGVCCQEFLKTTYLSLSGGPKGNIQLLCHFKHFKESGI